MPYLAILQAFGLKLLELAWGSWFKPRTPKTISQVQAEEESKPDATWDKTVDKL